MGDESYQQYRDDRTRMLGITGAPEHYQQKRHIDSVSARIGRAIITFCQERKGLTFHADDLRTYVRLHCGEVAPGSPDRILRDLRKRGLISYEVPDRAHSLYRVLNKGA